MTSPEPKRPLTRVHKELLKASGISPAISRQRGYRSIAEEAEFLRYEFRPPVQRRPGLLAPVYGLDGQVLFNQLRPDEPRVEPFGRPIKYETPAGQKLDLDCHPAIRERVLDLAEPLWITEGIRKGDAAVSAGLACIALLGVDCWQREGTPHQSWERIPLNGRDVFVCFDSDVMTKPEVASALARLDSFLSARGARVHRVYLPAGEPDHAGVPKKGLTTTSRPGTTPTTSERWPARPLPTDRSRWIGGSSGRPIPSRCGTWSSR